MRRLVPLALVFMTSVALAQTRDPTTAQTLFDQARDAMKKGDIARACPKFAESQRLDPKPGTLTNLAVCEEKRGSVASAWAHAREAIEQLDMGDDRLPLLRALVLRTEERLPKLVIRLAPDTTKGSRVRRDDVEVGDATMGEAIPVDPGEHTITVTAPGRKDATQKVTAVEGQTTQVEVTAGELAEPTPVVAPPSDRAKPETSSAPTQVVAPPSAGRSTTVGWVIGSSGVAVLALGAAFGAASLSNYHQADSLCRTHKDCGDDAISARSSAQTKAWISDVALGVGIVGVGIGGYLVLSGGSREVRVSVRGTGRIGIDGTF